VTVVRPGAPTHWSHILVGPPAEVTVVGQSRIVMDVVQDPVVPPGGELPGIVTSHRWYYLRRKGCP
jgi:hypothetical protein